ncbi:hypothetical protein HanIR_Chr05g0210401 [Helianthus annuus]|nr:hypothetical protein HanIR_Chr05g0210401 [Helianthus annuus]
MDLGLDLGYCVQDVEGNDSGMAQYFSHLIKGLAITIRAGRG